MLPQTWLSNDVQAIWLATPHIHWFIWIVLDIQMIAIPECVLSDIDLKFSEMYFSDYIARALR